MKLLTKDYDINDIAFLKEQTAQKPVDPPPQLISEFIQGLRVMPMGTPIPGPVDLSITPYLIEIMDNMSPYSPIQRTSIMKAAQVGMTFAIENVIGYWMKASPSMILYVTATGELLEKWTSKRLDPLIDSIGMRDRITAQTDNAKSRRTGDKLFSKQFIGGALEMGSAQSPGSLRSDSVRILIIDELDGAPAQLRTGEGSFDQVASARTNAWGIRKKICMLSTPTTYEESLTWIHFQAGDQRYYKVPCPHCNEFQILEFKNLKPTFEKGHLRQVHYECPHCSGKIFNYIKTVMFRKGYWESTAIPDSVYHRSYQISSMYSPDGALSWYQLYEIFLKAEKEPDGMRWFTQLYLGMPYREQGSRPKLENILPLRGNYNAKEVLDGVLFLTATIDVQEGSKKNKDNPARLEMEIIGHGAKFRTWSINYVTFKGAVEDPFAGAWEVLNEWAVDGGFKYYRSDGREFMPKIILIDSGTLTDVVYQFCSRWPNTYPCKGNHALKTGIASLGDNAGPHNFIRYKPSKVSEDLILFTISTNGYKRQIYRNLKLQRVIDEKELQERNYEQLPGFCDFPRDYGSDYFAMLIAEEMRADGSFYAAGRRNEALDCRVYNLAAGDIFLNNQLKLLRDKIKKKGATPTQLKAINHGFLLDMLAKGTARVKPGQSGNIPFKG
ncbi:phage terminase large subunit family protein [Candidatus Pacearchaeota archaeon]|nr:phage terminase large subunit family protein [Candidatus Pacearchaeota archaeon]